MVDISVVLVTWNTKKIVCECLDSLRNCKGDLSLQIIVVDNASSDGTPEAIAELYPEVQLIRNSRNLGFAGANNIGIKESVGRHVCLVNSDVIVPPGCFEKMCAFMEQQPRIGLLGPLMRLTDGSIGPSCMRFPTVWNWFGRALALDTIFRRWGWFGGFLMTDFKYDRTQDVEVLTGWFWVVRREALDEVGLLDERFFMYGEDIEWSRRFHEYGWRVVFYPAAEALHYGGASSANAPTRFYVEMQRANMQYVKKYHGRMGRIGFWLATGLNETVRILGYAFAYLFRSNFRAAAAEKIKRSMACLRWLTGSDRQSTERSVSRGGLVAHAGSEPVDVP